jgi:hypothetical protein
MSKSVVWGGLAVCGAVAIFAGAAAVLADVTVWERGLFAALALVAGMLVAAVLPQARGRPHLVLIRVVDEGIEHPKAGLLAWEELDHVRVHRVLGVRQLGIWTKDPDLVGRRWGTRGARFWARVSRLLGWPALAYGPPAVDPQDLLAEIAARRPELVERG